MKKLSLIIFALVATASTIYLAMRTRSNLVSTQELRTEAGVTKSSTNNQFSSTWQSLDTSLFQIESIRLMAGDSEPITQKTVQALAKKLLEHPNINNVETVPFGTLSTPGARLPDAMFVIELRHMTEESSLFEAKRTTMLHMSGGSLLMTSRFSHSDSLTTPTFNWSIKGTVNHELSHEGMRVAAKLDSLTADKLSEALNKAIGEKLDEFLKKAPAPQRLPAYFYPAYQAQALPASLAARQPIQLLAGNRAFSPYESLWILSVTPEELEPLAAMKGQLQAEGWTIQRIETKANSIPGLRATRQKHTEVIQIWPKTEAPMDTEYVLRHQLRLSKSALRSIVDQAFDSQANVNLLAHLHHGWSPDQQARFIQYFEQAVNYPDEALTAWVLAEAYEKMGRQEDALDLLNLSYLLGRIEGKTNDSRLTNRGKEWSGNSSWRPTFPSQKTLDTLGIPQIDHGATIAPLTLKKAQHALFSAHDRNEKPLLVFFRVHSLGEQHYSVTCGSVGLNQSQFSKSETTSECSKDMPIVAAHHLKNGLAQFRYYKNPEAADKFILECKVQPKL